VKLDRLMGILTLLLQREKVTAPLLAARFDVSRRTILRDIEALSAAGIPVVTTRGGDGGIAIMEGYKLDKSLITPEEMASLLAGLRGVASVTKAAHITGLLDKLAPVGAADSIAIDLACFYQDSLADKIAMLKRAIAERKSVCFDYYYEKGEVRREADPHLIQFAWSSWYLLGWCRLREDFRRFKLNRLWGLEVTDNAFEPRPVPPETAKGQDAFPDKYHVKVLFDKSVRFRLIDDYGPHSYQETPEGLLMALDYANPDYMFSWILGFGDKARVLDPPDMRRAIAQAAANLNRIYAPK